MHHMECTSKTSMFLQPTQCTEPGKTAPIHEPVDGTNNYQVSHKRSYRPEEHCGQYLTGNLKLVI